MIICLTFSCSRQPDMFKVYNADFNSMSRVLAENKVKYYETYFLESDSAITISIVKLDTNGNVVETKSGKGIIKNDRRIQYDSLGRLVNYTVDSDIYVDNSVTYQLYPEQRLVIVKWTDKLLGDATFNHLLYDENLSKILRSTTISDNMLDTLSDEVYEYDLDRLLKVRNKGNLETEYFYNDSGKLEEIRWADSKRIDYISRTTGLIDSAVYEDQGEKRTTYWRYYK